MRIVHITGAAPAGPEDAEHPSDRLVRIIVESRRWWQRRTRFAAMVLVGQPGDWRPYRGKKMPPYYVVLVVEAAFKSAMKSIQDDMAPKHPGPGFKMSAPRAVSVPRDGLTPPDDVSDTSEETMNRSLNGAAE